MLDKQVLKIDDPRDAFALMLLERIDALEEQVSGMHARLEGVEAHQQQERVFHLEKTNNFSCFGFVSGSFFMRSVKPAGMTADEFKEKLVQVARMVLDTIGMDKFVTLTVVVGTRDGGHTTSGDMYINLKKQCFIYQIYKMLSQLSYPIPVNLRWDNLVDMYMLHVNQGSQGEYYSVFDTQGLEVDMPQWTAWSNTVDLHLGNQGSP